MQILSLLPGRADSKRSPPGGVANSSLLLPLLQTSAGFNQSSLFSAVWCGADRADHVYPIISIISYFNELGLAYIICCQLFKLSTYTLLCLQLPLLPDVFPQKINFSIPTFLFTCSIHVNFGLMPDFGPGSSLQYLSVAFHRRSRYELSIIKNMKRHQIRRTLSVDHKSCKLKRENVRHVTLS